MRLEQAVAGDVLKLVAYFNSIKVRLEQNNNNHSALAHQFQFHKGAIRTVLQRYDLLEAHHFNSIKVRLEHRCTPVLDYAHIFQFHKGAIRTNV